MKQELKESAIKTKLPFIVESGNWKVRVLFSPVDDELNEFSYIEACTRAFEFMFGNGTNEEVTLLSLTDKNKKEYVDVYYKGEGPEASDKYGFPDAQFGVYVICKLEDDTDKKEKWWYTLASTVFKNASQTKYIEYSEEIEKRFAASVAKIKKLERLKKNKG